MDIVRKNPKRDTLRSWIAISSSCALACGGLIWWTSQMDNSTPVVDDQRLWFGEVELGEMVRETRGVGTLVPEELRWVPAQTNGRVEKILARPGAQVEPNTVIMVLSNPELEQSALEAELDYSAAQADYTSYDIMLQGKILEQKAKLAELRAEREQAMINAKIDEELHQDGLVSRLNLRRSELLRDQLNTRFELETQMLEYSMQTLGSQLEVKWAQLEQVKSKFELLQRQQIGLRVTAGVSGVLQKQNVEEGMQVAIGENLSQVANPKNLKAVVRIAEINAKDLSIGLEATVDTRNGKVRGLVSRVDPNVENGTVAVDIHFTEPLPSGARPDLTVEGLIEFERLASVVKVKRPALSRPETETTIFKLEADSNLAVRIPVAFGRASLSDIEIAAGLRPGDRIVLADMSEWQGHNQIRIQ